MSYVKELAEMCAFYRKNFWNVDSWENFLFVRWCTEKVTSKIMDLPRTCLLEFSALTKLLVVNRLRVRDVESSWADKLDFGHAMLMVSIENFTRSSRKPKPCGTKICVAISTWLYVMFYGLKNWDVISQLNCNFVQTNTLTNVLK